MSNIVKVGDEKQLFIDDRWFLTQRGVTLRVNAPVKSERVLLPEKPWESKGIHAYGTIMEHDGVYRMWYDAIGVIAGEPPHERSLCYATSRDGLHWERQNVGLFDWGGIRENNIVIPGFSGSVMLDPKGPDEHRFKALATIKENDVWPESKGCICGCYDGKYFMELYLCTSPDGIHWRRQEPSALPFFHDSQNVFFYDTRLKKYVAYVRWDRGVSKTGARCVARTEFDDPMELPWPYRYNPGAEQGPGRSLRRTGDELPVVLCADDADPPDTDLYTPCVHQYPWAADAYFSFTTPYRHYPVGDTSETTAQGKDQRGRFRNDGPIEVQLAVSRDGIDWDRPDRRPYVPLGLDGDWDGGTTYMSLGMIRRGDEVWQYYSGTRHTHGAYDPEKADCGGGIGRLVQRLDGFISADADYTGAEFTTPLIAFTGRHLQLNVDCSAMGEVWVEVLDEQNRPIAGYRMEDAVSVDRNRIAAPVAWQERDNVGELAGRPVRLHFKLRACRLYAFQFVRRPE